MKSATNVSKILFLSFFSLLFIFVLQKNNFSIPKKYENYLTLPLKYSTKENTTHNSPNLYVSMAICWSENTKFHGKSQYPYKEAALYSIRLWLRLTTANVLLKIVYNGNKIQSDMLNYITEITQMGGIVQIVQNDGDMNCVLRAQLTRLLAFQHKLVNSEDLIMISDVDAFIMTPKITKPLKLKKNIWIYRYEITRSNGYTFMLQFMTAKARIWSQMLNSDSKSVLTEKNLLQDYQRKFAIQTLQNYTWDVDQKLVSHSILSQNLCFLSKNNRLWKIVNLEPRKFNDAKSCYHGPGYYEDCNNQLWARNIMIRYYGGSCKWWHFLPHESKDKMKEKYEEIINGLSERGIFTSALQSARKIQDETLKKVF